MRLLILIALVCVCMVGGCIDRKPDRGLPSPCVAADGVLQGANHPCGPRWHVNDHWLT